MILVKYVILHFSDLHFGEHSLLEVSKFKHQFSNYFELIKSRLEDLIDKNNVELAIISGDFTSKGKKLKNSNFAKFLKIISDKKIPTITCVGNHDLIEVEIDKDKQFKIYVKIIKKHKQLLGIDTSNEKIEYKLSENFNINQASYIYFKDYNSVFYSLNSCKNIEIVSIKNISTNEITKEQTFRNIGFLTLKDLEDFFEEIEKKIGGEIFKKSLKFLICHHGFNYGNSAIIMNKLKEIRNRFVFSGHEHNYKNIEDQYNLKLKNFVAGSLFVIPEERTKNLDFITYDLQFNRYEINTLESTLSCFLNKYEEGKWNEYTMEENLQLDIYNFEKIDNGFHYANEYGDVFCDQEMISNFEERYNINLDSLITELEEIGCSAFDAVGNPFEFKKWFVNIEEILKSKLFYLKFLKWDNKNRDFYKDENNLVWLIAKNSKRRIKMKFSKFK